MHQGRPFRCLTLTVHCLQSRIPVSRQSASCMDSLAISSRIVTHFFISAFWRELFRLCGTQLRMSTTYHPQIDGQAEVLNCVLEQYLRSFVHDRPSQWFKHLALTEWSYNTSIHSGTGISPFEATYGKPPPSIPQYLQGTSRVAVVDDILTTRTKLHATLRRRLHKA